MCRTYCLILQPQVNSTMLEMWFISAWICSKVGEMLGDRQKESFASEAQKWKEVYDSGDPMRRVAFGVKSGIQKKSAETWRSNCRSSCIPSHVININVLCTPKSAGFEGMWHALWYGFATGVWKTFAKRQKAWRARAAGSEPKLGVGTMGEAQFTQSTIY